MPIHDQGYRRYGGQREAHGRTWLVIARAGMIERLRERKFLGLLLVAWLPFLVRSVQLYVAANYEQAAALLAPTPATFSFLLAAAGSRTIDAWWVAGSNRSSAAVFIVYDADGLEVGRVNANQQTGGGQWNALGTFAFKAGWNRVVLSRWQAPGSVVIADAIRAR